MGDKTEIEDDLESLLSCPICMDDYEDPRMLPCQHSFCENCLTEYIQDSSKSNKNTGAKTFRCPICRSKTKERRDQNDGSGFPKDLTICGLLESKDKLIEEDGHSSDATGGNNDEAAVAEMDFGTYLVEQTSSRIKPYLRPKRRGTSLGRRQKQSRKNASKVTAKKNKGHEQVAVETHNHDQNYRVLDNWPVSLGDVIIKKIIIPHFVRQQDKNNTFEAYMWLLISWIVLLFVLYLYPYSTTLLSGIYIVVSYKSARLVVCEQVHAVCEDCLVSRFTVIAYLIGQIASELTLVILSLCVMVIFKACTETVRNALTDSSSAEFENYFKLISGTFFEVFIICPAFRLESICQQFVSFLLKL